MTYSQSLIFSATSILCTPVLAAHKDGISGAELDVTTGAGTGNDPCQSRRLTFHKIRTTTDVASANTNVLVVHSKLNLRRQRRWLSFNRRLDNGYFKSTTSQRARAGSELGLFGMSYDSYDREYEEIFAIEDSQRAF